jgi:hypothetical protein
MDFYNLKMMYDSNQNINVASLNFDQKTREYYGMRNLKFPKIEENQVSNIILQFHM